MMVWFQLHQVERKGGTDLNFAHAEYEGELEARVWIKTFLCID
jgi:hypothetical protein